MPRVSAGGIPQVWMLEEGSDSLRHAAQSAKMGGEEFAQVITAHHEMFADAVVLEVISDELIRVELWRVRGKKEQAELPFGRVHVVPHLLGAMSGMTIDDQEYATA